MIDSNYSIEIELYEGFRKWVLRYKGDFIAASFSRSAMTIRAVGHKAVMGGAVIIEGKDG